MKKETFKKQKGEREVERDISSTGSLSKYYHQPTVEPGLGIQHKCFTWVKGTL